MAYLRYYVGSFHGGPWTVYSEVVEQVDGDRIDGSEKVIATGLEDLWVATEMAKVLNQHGPVFVIREEDEL